MGVAAIIRDTGEVVDIGSHGLDLPGKASQIGLELPDDLTFEQWEGIGHSLQGVEHSLMWWIGDWLSFGDRKYGDKYTAAIESTGRAYQTLRNAKAIAEAFEMSRRRDVLSWSHHAEVASLPAEAADRMLALAEKERLSTRDLRQRVSQAKAAARLLTSEPGTDTCQETDLWRLVESGTKFKTIYADPPWQYDNQGTRAATGNHYEGMSIDEICALPVRDLAAEDAHLHLWTTNGFLFECPKIFEAWGFEFKSSFVWVKPQIGTGNYWRNAHEILLTAVRGDAKRFNNRKLKSWLVCRRGRHSAKPEQVRHFIEKASAGPFLELFGRSQSKGWVVWGNQIERSLFDENVNGVIG